MLDSFFTHTINVTRNSDVLLSAASLPISSTVGTTYSSQDITLEIAIPDGTTASFDIVGRLNGATLSETVSITAAPLTRVTAKHYDYLQSITSTGGDAGTATVKLRTRLGQPVVSESAVFSALKVRVEKAGSSGRVDESIVGSVVEDKTICFTTTSENAILQKDKVTNTATLETYEVEDVNTFYGPEVYHHSELILVKT